MIALTGFDYDCDYDPLGTSHSASCHRVVFIYRSNPIPSVQKLPQLSRVPHYRPRKTIFIEHEDRDGSVTVERVFFPFAPYRFKITKRDRDKVKFHRAMGNANTEER